VKNSAWKAPVAAFVLTLMLYLSTSYGGMDSWDAELYFRLTESIVERHSLVIPEDEQRAGGEFSFSDLRIGQSLAAIPLYLLGKAVNGDTRFFVSLLNPIVTALTVSVVYLFAGVLGYSQAVRIFVALSFAIGSLAWPYSKTFFREPLAALSLLVTALAACLYRSSHRGRWILGAGGAYVLALITRWDSVIAAPLFLAYVIWPSRLAIVASCRRVARPLLVGALVFVAGALYASGVLGEATVTIARSASLISDGTALRAITVSGSRGIVWYMPVMFLSLLAWPAFWRRSRDESLLFGALIVERILVVAANPFWDGGVCWGPRFLVPIVPFLTLPAGLLLDTQTHRRLKVAVATTVLAVSVLVQIVGVSFHYDRFHETVVVPGQVSSHELLWNPRYSPIVVQGQWLLQGKSLDLLVPLEQAFPGQILISPADLPATLHPVGLTYGGMITLLGYELDRERIEPGGRLRLTLYWKAVAAPGRNYLAFIHLVDSDGRIVGQTQAPPAGGDQPTRDWQPGQIRRYVHSVVVADDVRWPGRLGVRIGFFRPATMQQLGAEDEIGRDQTPDPVVAWITVNSSNDAPAVKTNANFDNQIVLMGFDPPPAPLDGLGYRGWLTLTLYWQALRRMEKDYTVFVHLEDNAGRIWAQSDSLPVDGRYPTSLWAPGEIVMDEHVLESLPGGTFQVYAGLYDSPSVKPLDLVLPDGTRQHGSVLLGQVHIDPHFRVFLPFIRR
jgi:hypothetical protein